MMRRVVRFKPEAVIQLISRSWGLSMLTKLQKLSLFLRGWITYYGIANQYQLAVDLDYWIRRRVRMCFWKQWRKPKTKVRSLIRLGVPLKIAVSCGSSSKGYWRSSKTKGINARLSNEHLTQQGLFSLKEGWISFHYGGSPAM
ncbi:MAG: hypothetical protein HN790_03090 [Methylococcales bacterium]|jgi:RNA-directed DNA polymerase|nr:hypothetical protein [Methylococcales bacterium]